MDRVRDLASKKAAVIFTKSSCCMCHSIKALFYELGASPAVHELDMDASGREMERALRALGCNPSVPAVFVGGKFIGSAKDVISLHVDGSLKQMLIDAKAICEFVLQILKMDKVMRLVSEKGVVIFSKSSCCLCYAVNILFQELGVKPINHEIDKDPEGREMERALIRMGCNGPVPAVFIDGKLVGSTNEVMSLHLSGSLIPLLKPYRSLS
ncbi:Glutaredoxin [Dillenia turbinata]|uniref:Glutaredoxin n=1 Tax=Dillenia turbinata TaxID=194707 RepID=A0AAN8VWL0_9MAGN